MKVGDVISAYESGEGVTLHTLSSLSGDVATLEISFYPYDHPNFPWAVEQAKIINNRTETQGD